MAALAELTAPCLLVIDNANDPDDLAATYPQLSRCDNLHLLLSTRISEFEGAERLRIEGLPEAEALALFRKYYPRHRPEEDALFKQIRQAVGGNTLVVELLAKNLHQFNRLKSTYTLPDLLADLQGRGLLRLSQSRDVSTAYQSKDGGLRREKPEDIIAAMYDLSQLSPEESAVLSAFAVLPAENIGFDILEMLLEPVPSADPSAAPSEAVTSSDRLTSPLDARLLSLSQKGWLTHTEAETSFKCSPVVQEITCLKNPQLREDCAVLIAQLKVKLLYEAGTGHFLNASYEDAAAYARYAESIIACFPAPENDIAILCERVGNYHKTTGNLDKALGHYETYHRLEKELHEAFPSNVAFKNGLAIACSKLGETQSSLGDLDMALGYYETFHHLEKQLLEAFPDNVDFKNNLAESYQLLGTVYEKKEMKSEAFAYYRTAQALWVALVVAAPGYVKFKKNLAWVEGKLAGAGRLEGAGRSKVTPQRGTPQNGRFKCANLEDWEGHFEVSP